jgi:hypothetical protein
MRKQKTKQQKKKGYMAPGWLYRQFQKVEKEIAKWPKWMKEGLPK